MRQLSASFAHARIIFPIVGILFAPCLSLAASFTPLGFVPGGDPGDSGSNATDVSDDGLVVVGGAAVYGEAGTSGPYRGSFRWTPATGMVSLGAGNVADETFRFSNATAVSGDGSTVIGYTNAPLAGTSYNVTTFRWRESTGFTLPFSSESPPSFLVGYAEDVSADGRVITGAVPFEQAFRYVEDEGFTFFGPVPNTDFPNGTNGSFVSRDGTIVAGSLQQNLNERTAFRWTAATGVVSLGDLPGGNIDSAALGVSGDGSAIVGFGTTALSSRIGFRWTEGAGMIPLGTLPGRTESIALDAAAGGSIVVGYSTIPGVSEQAFIWDEVAGIQSLLDVLVARGATGLDGWTLSDATAITPDGRWVVGTGIGPDGRSQAYRAELNAVPLPASVWLLGTGLVALLRRRFSRR